MKLVIKKYKPHPGVYKQMERVRPEMKSAFQSLRILCHHKPLIFQEHLADPC